MDESMNIHKSLGFRYIYIIANIRMKVYDLSIAKNLKFWLVVVNV